MPLNTTVVKGSCIYQVLLLSTSIWTTHVSNIYPYSRKTGDLNDFNEIHGFWSFKIVSLVENITLPLVTHDDVIKWKHFPCYWSFVRGIHRGQRPVTRNFDIFFNQWWGWWFETPSCPLWRHRNAQASLRHHELYLLAYVGITKCIQVPRV